ncbi:MAG: PssE/Cps14G family polysaccharide biosynthesis glycosyltransferase [bacterium]|jgi:UDP-N-acetylglucosamine transferase subunit ALG13
MIFVTVGSSKFGFCELIKAMDAIVPHLSHPVIMQIGNGLYVPRNCESFRFTTSIFDYYDQADLVVTCGGVGTVFELLYAQKRIVAVNNHVIPDQHQNEILQKLSLEELIHYCDSLSQLQTLIDSALQAPVKMYQPPQCSIEDHILQLKNQSGKFSYFYRLLNWNTSKL